MKVFQVRNVHQAMPEALRALKLEGYQAESRNGPVIRFDGLVVTVYERPAERVMFWADRNANPFFHLYESLWMLAGRNDVAAVTPYVARMKDFSDDGHTFHGAYGHRWRRHFKIDQLAMIIDRLRADPTDRRQVLSMWDANVDLGRNGKDLPCNLQAVFSVDAAGRLDMMVTNRSNDLIWGAYGANAVHFSYLHEYVARSLGREQGRYHQVSFNTHAYLNTLGPVEHLGELADDLSLMPPEMRWNRLCPYHDGQVAPFPLMTVDRETWDRELAMFMEEPWALGFTDPFFRRVAVPMAAAWSAWRSRADSLQWRLTKAQEHLNNCAATDWRLAGQEWLQRAAERARRAQDDGPQAAG